LKEKSQGGAARTCQNRGDRNRWERRKADVIGKRTREESKMRVNHIS